MTTERTTIESTVSPRLWLWVTGIIAAFLAGWAGRGFTDRARSAQALDAERR